MMRYNRQIQLDEVGFFGQEKLHNAKILIVGVGGLGCPAAQYLVGAGVGTIGLMDHDTVSITNLHRQVLFSESNLGQSKALIAKQKLQQLNSDIKLIAIAEALTIDNAKTLFRQYDLILDGTDNFETKYLINDVCILTGKPWVYASIYKNEGQLSVFNYKNGPSYRCLFPETTQQNVSCEVTGVLGVVPGLFGMFQALEALKIILDIGNVLSGKLKLSNLLSGSEQILAIKRNSEEIERVKKNGIIQVRMACELKDKSKIYLDVRENFEQPKINTSNVIQIPLRELQSRTHEIPKKENIYVFCQSGKRSLKAIELLRSDYGFQNLKNVEEGIETIING